MTNTNQVCLRCNGSGFIAGFIHNEGGECFACNGIGRKLSAFDKFYSKSKGAFYGVSYVEYGKPVNSGTVKALYNFTPKELAECAKYSYMTVTALTEEQARKFFAKYGTETKV